MKKIRGVNLGSWLVLERWMIPYLFDDMALEDEGKMTLDFSSYEYTLKRNLHYASFITERDFMKIKAMGLNLIRIPVPHTMFHPQSQVVHYIDHAFMWAKKYGLLILLDLHTVPGGQNGLDNSCHYHQITWDQSEENIKETYIVLEKMMKRYGHQECLYGIEPMNEPFNEFMFQIFKHDYTKNSKPICQRNLKQYYQTCYEMLQKYCPHAKLVIHDSFDLGAWNDFMVGKGYENVVIDTHFYLNFERIDKNIIELDDYLNILNNRFLPQLEQASQYHDILVGEWSLGQKITHPNEREKICHILFEQQRKVYEKSSGWVFWNYKVLSPDRLEWDYELLFQTQLINKF